MDHEFEGYCAVYARGYARIILIAVLFLDSLSGGFRVISKENQTRGTSPKVFYLEELEPRQT
jgi:hypothetical protein